MGSLAKLTCLCCLFLLPALTGKAQQAARTPVSLDVPAPATTTSKDTAVVIERSGPVKASSLAVPANKDAASDQSPVIIHETQPLDKPKRNR